MLRCAVLLSHHLQEAAGASDEFGANLTPIKSRRDFEQLIKGGYCTIDGALPQSQITAALQLARVTNVTATLSDLHCCSISSFHTN